MKREAFNHTKMKLLARKVGGLLVARGIMATLWNMVAREAPSGDIGKKSDDEIALGIDYDGDATELIGWLVDIKFLDRHPEHRLVVHDWFDHCEDSIHMALARSAKRFASGEIPKMGRFNKDEREKLQAAYEREGENARHTHDVRTAHALPSPTKPGPAEPSQAEPSPTQPDAVVRPIESLSNPEDTPEDAVVIAGTIDALGKLLGSPLKAHRNEPQRVEAWARAHLARPPPVIHGQAVPMREVLARTVRLKSEQGGSVTFTGFMSWAESVIDRCVREQVWPNEWVRGNNVPGKTVTKPRDYSKL